MIQLTGDVLLMKLNRQAELKGDKWLAEMAALDDSEFFAQMRKCKAAYLYEYEILCCIRLLTDGVPINPLAAAPNAVKDFRIIDGHPKMFGLDTVLGRMGFCKLSEIMPIADDGIPTLLRQGICHRKAYEIFASRNENAKLVTGLVSILADRNTYLHSWVESEYDGVYDYTLNIAINTPHYKMLMHAQEPLIVVEKSELTSGKINREKWVKMIRQLYG